MHHAFRWTNFVLRPQDALRSKVSLIMIVELSGVQFALKSYAWFQNGTSAPHEFDLKSQVRFQTKIARHEVQLPLYYIHFEIAQTLDLVSSYILLIQYWAGLKLNFPPFFWYDPWINRTSDFKMGLIKRIMRHLPVCLQRDALCVQMNYLCSAWKHKILTNAATCPSSFREVICHRCKNDHRSIRKWKGISAKFYQHFWVVTLDWLPIS